MKGNMSSFQNQHKPFQMSYRRLFSIIFTVLTVVNILSMVINTSLYLHRIGHKEHLEKHSSANTNRDAYAVARFVHFGTLIVGIAVRIAGLIAIGVCGKEFADSDFEISDRRESFTGSLCYTCAMVVLLAAYYVGIVRLMPHDLVIHCLLTIIGMVFIGFSLQHQEIYSKQMDTLPI